MPKYRRLADVVRELVSPDEPQAPSPIAFDEPLVTTTRSGAPLTIRNVEELHRAIAERTITAQVLEEFLFRPCFSFDRHVIDAALGIPRVGHMDEILRQRHALSYYYVPSATGEVMELINRVAISPRMKVYEIGSGWGKPAILLALLTDAKVVGIEWEQSYCDKATEAAKNLNVQNATFVCADAVEADLTDGDIFYMYHPFSGKTLDAFLDKTLLRVAKLRPVILVFAGPGSKQARKRSWLVEDHSYGRNPLYRQHCGVFYSDPSKVAPFESPLPVKQAVRVK